MPIITDVKLDFKDVLLQPKRSTLKSRSQVDLVREYKFKNGKVWNGTGIVAANMDHTGTFEMAKELASYGLMVALHKHYTAEELIDFYSNNYDIWDNVFYAMGITDDDVIKFKKVWLTVHTKFSEVFSNVCVDVANGYSEGFLDFVKQFKEDYPDSTVMAGNVVTGDMTQELILAGVDIVKVGIGPGSVCTTRVKTGVGYPQLSAVMECSDAAHGVGGYVCADGGCNVPGDIAKAFGAGADFVMAGGMFAGHDECSGKEIYGNGSTDGQAPTHLKFYGMSSEEAQEAHGSSLKDYRASEGKSVLVPYRGPVSNTLQDILGGLRSACTYVGARRLKDLPKCTTFVRCTQQENQVFSDK